MNASASSTAVAVVVLVVDFVDEEVDKSRGFLVDYVAKHLLKENSH